MTTIEPGFHPWLRLVRRLSKIAPHRQVQLLCAISVGAVAVIVASTFFALEPTQTSLDTSNQTLVPAVDRLDVARENYNDVAGTLQLTDPTDPTVRLAAISQLTTLNSTGEAGWNDYVRLSSHLPGERALQQTFVKDRKIALDAGTAFVTKTVVTAADVTAVTRLADALRLDLNRIKALYQSRVQRSISDATHGIEATQHKIMLISAGALLLLLIAFAVASRSARSREERLEELDRTLYEDAERNELEARMQRSLEMTHTETGAYELVGRALTITVPGVPAELLVADSSRAHFRQVTTSDSNSGPGCPVTSPTECPAATWGQAQVWNSSTALDACPYLQGRPSGECSAVCVPVSIGGKTVGVVHATAPDMQPPNDLVVAKVELIARKVGERVGLLRAFLRSETQAHTDPLTGLMNRRSVESRVRDLTEQSHSYVAAYGDLDHFKALNDLHGHDAGDQALRLFARVLRDTVRPNDLTARYGGEEFVIVLPDCTVDDAYAVVDRIRESLALAQVAAAGPRFTVSFGIARSRPELTFSETLEEADAALLDAKAKGRDRVVIAGSAAGSQSTGISSEPVSSEAPTISITRS